VGEGGLISLRSVPFSLSFSLSRSIFNAFKKLPLRSAEFPGANIHQADRIVYGNAILARLYI